MLYPARVVERLAASAERFRAFAEYEVAAFRAFDQTITLLEGLDREAIIARLRTDEHPGALPGEEWEHPGGLIVPFGEVFPHHRAARQWALRQIAGITTVAVDGSEIKPTKDYSIPIAAVQVAWFENPHRADRRYIKDVRFDIVPPDELGGEVADGFGTADQQLALRRFRSEIDAAIERIRALAHHSREERPPVVFFDGSLVVSFAAGMLEEYGTRYIEAICRLVAESEAARIPIVGYVDTSLAKDLTTMLAVIGGLSRAQRIPDSRLIDHRLSWGDRTRALVCARDDVLVRYRDHTGRDYSREICFVYLKTSQFAPPARLDIPRWIIRAGLLDHVVDVVRAEVIVGNGYPYCIETADACAVLSARDRERFYRLLQDFTARQGIALRIVPKAASKRRRRI